MNILHKIIIYYSIRDMNKPFSDSINNLKSLKFITINVKNTDDLIFDIINKISGIEFSQNIRDNEDYFIFNEIVFVDYKFPKSKVILNNFVKKDNQYNYTVCYFRDLDEKFNIELLNKFASEKQ